MVGVDNFVAVGFGALLIRGVIDSGLKFYSGSDVMKVSYWAAAAELVPTAAPPVLKL